MIVARKIKSSMKLLTDPDLRFIWLAQKGLLDWMPDEKYLKKMYRIRMGKELDLEHPRDFNEKMQWLKLYDRKPIYSTMVDKAEAKRYVADIIGEKYIIPTLGVWDRFDDIDFSALPDQFVLKCTHDSGSQVICRDKKTLDIPAARKKLTRALHRKFGMYGREWPYLQVKPRILAEKYMEDHGDPADGKLPQGLRDYKFYCFDGEPKLLYVSQGLEDHDTAQISFLTMDWQFSGIGRADFKPLAELPPKPSRFDEMAEVSRKLSKGIRFLRVDLYEIDGQVYFGELTFCSTGGYMPFDPPEWDAKLGDLLKL